MVNGVDHPAAGRGGVPPGAQAGDHVLAHLVAQGEPRGGAAPALGGGEVFAIGRSDGVPDGVGGQARGEGVEKGADLVVADFPHAGEGGLGPADGLLGDGLLSGRDMQ